MASSSRGYDVLIILSDPTNVFRVAHAKDIVAKLSEAQVQVEIRALAGDHLAVDPLVAQGVKLVIAIASPGKQCQRVSRMHMDSP